MTDLGDRLRQIREAEGLAQRAFADRVTAAGFAVSAAAVSGYESGKTDKVPAGYVSAVCREFGRSPTWVLWGEGPEEAVPPDETGSRLEAVRRALEMPIDVIGAPKQDTSDRTERAEYLIELVDALTDLDGPGEGPTRSGALHAVDLIASNLIEVGLLSTTEKALWEAFKSGADVGEADDVVESATTRILGDRTLPTYQLAEVLYDLGERLHYAGHYRSAAHTHELSYHSAVQAGDAPRQTTAALRAARCHKRAPDSETAVEWYGRGMRHAQNQRDWLRLGQAWAGLAGLRHNQGAVSEARKLYGKALSLGLEKGNAHLTGEGHHGMAICAEMVDPRASAWHAWQAVQVYSEPELRMASLVVVGEGLLRMGYLDAAEAAFAVTAVGQRDFSNRALSAHGLAYVAAVRGDGDEYERRRRSWSEQYAGRLSMRNQAGLNYEHACALSFLGRVDEAARAFRTAIEHASAYGMNRVLFYAEQGLADLGHGRPPFSVPSQDPDPEIDEIVAGVHRLQQELLGTGKSD